MAAPRISEQEELAIVEALKAGESVSSVARRFGRAKSSVSKIGSRWNVDVERSRTQKLAQAVSDYARDRRLQLLNRGFAKAERMLDAIDDPGDLRNWVIAVATLIDKRRLEDGEVTGRYGFIEPEAVLRRGREALRVIRGGRA